MSLTGRLLIVLAFAATFVVGGATVAFWSRGGGRRRLLMRVAGVLLCEALVVASAGLVLNRREQFYPSWQALGGSTGTTATTDVPAAGGLDRSLTPGGDGPATGRPWQPAGSASWRLAAHPNVLVPVDYLRRSATAFPVLLALPDSPGHAMEAVSAAAATPDVVGVVATPSPATTVRSLAAGMPAALAHDLRVTTRGWALLVPARRAALAVRIMQAAPGRFATLVVIADRSPVRFAAGALPTVGLSVAIVRAPPPVGSAGAPLPTGAVVLTAGGAAAWRTGAAWAARQTPMPLTPPLVLPPATVRPPSAPS